MTTRKTYEKYHQIDEMFNRLEHQIVNGGDLSYMRQHYFFLDEFHRQNYESLRLYYYQADDSPLIDGACYLISITEIFNEINIFDYEVPFDFIFDNGELSTTFQNLNIYYQYLLAAALEVSDVKIFNPSGYSLGMNHWNITQMKLFWQYTAIVRREAQ
ncbi:DUF2538 family protein [Macrococcus hajekii]|uniref:DUF2538 family protein n=1 Tax=Macrococcus hajekii TaxID=198482 RepID=A0A4R6BNY8_9STAP|nr:DUF2538 family protein [Macrococcus hajekii]TDM03387.1 DUF2538 family protein [Macrococcus hajekii]GGA98433.1 hypothetical protein GCM10007190_03060 [Macrococcus hajekii]